MTWCRRKLVEPDCTLCPLKRATQVPPEGDPRAKIAIVGEGPGCLTPGQYVYDETFEPQLLESRVLDDETRALFRRHYEGDVYCIEALGHRCELTPEHLVWACTAERAGHQRRVLTAPQWLPAHALTEAFFVVVPKRTLLATRSDADNEVLIPSRLRKRGGGQTLVPAAFAVDDLTAFVLGLFLGDGHAAEVGGTVAWHLSRGYKERYVTPVVEFLRRLNIRAQVKRRKENINVFGYSSVLARTLGEAFYTAPQGARGHGETKQIPLWVWRWTPRAVAQFLFGWHEADGKHLRDLARPKTITTVSSRAVAQGIDLAIRLGVFPTLVMTPPRGKARQVCYDIRFGNSLVRKLGWPLPLHDHKERVLYQEDEKNFYVPIRRVRKRSYRGLVYDQTTRSHRYAVPFVVHNSTEVRLGRPFIGDSGQMLTWLLERAGLPKREQLWISNAALCLPRWVEIDAEAGLIKTEAQTKEESTQIHCRPRLFAELDIVRPKVVIAVGALALRALTGAKGILKYHGALFPATFGGQRSYVMGTFHPAHLLRGETRKIQAVIDVYRKARRLAQHEPEPPGEYLLVTPHNPRGPDRVIAELAQVVDAVIAAGYDVAVDVEATSEKAVNTALTVFGFGVERLNLGVAINVLAWNRERQTYEVCWTREQWARIYNAIAKLLASRLTKWFWNLNFDVTVLLRHWPMMQGPYADGIHWHWLMQPDLPHNLGFACQEFLDVGAWKAGFWDKQETGEGTNQDLVIYNAQDALHTAKVIPHLKAAVYHRGNGHLVAHQLRVAELARKAYIHGIPCDRQVLAAKRAECERERDARLAVIRAAVKGNEQDLNEYVFARRCRNARASAERRGVTYREPKHEVIEAATFNVNSPLQMTWLLYRHYDLVVEQRTPSDEPRTSYKAILNYLAGHPGSEVFKAFTEYSEYEAPLRKFNEFEAAIDAGTHRIHPPWNVTGQAGTRWKSSDPNMQNLTKIMKECLAAEPGYCWVGADAAQLEKRISACFAGVKRLLEVFNRPPYDEKAEEWKKYDPAWDAHSLLCAMIFGDGFLKAPRKVQKKLRTMVKRVNYGMDYGAFPPKIQQTILADRSVTSDLRAELIGEAGLAYIQTIFDGVHSYFPELDRWAAAQIAYVRKKGYQLIPPLERRRYWPVRDIEEPKLRNTPIQVAAGDVVNLLFCAMDDAIVAEGLRATMVIHGHDACYWYTWRPHAARVCQIVNEKFDTWLAGPAGPVHITGFASVGGSPAEVA